MKRIIAVSVIALGVGASVISGGYHRNTNRTLNHQQHFVQRTDLEAPSPDSPESAIRWRRLAWVDEKGEIPSNALTSAINQREGNTRYWTDRGRPESAGISPSSWVSRGPQNVGGRTRSLVIHPADPNVLWAGSVSGGVWKSTNGGQFWTALPLTVPSNNDPISLFALSLPLYVFYEIAIVVGRLQNRRKRRAAAAAAES